MSTTLLLASMNRLDEALVFARWAERTAAERFHRRLTWPDSDLGRLMEELAASDLDHHDALERLEDGAADGSNAA